MSALMLWLGLALAQDEVTEPVEEPTEQATAVVAGMVVQVGQPIEAGDRLVEQAEELDASTWMFVCR